MAPNEKDTLFSVSFSLERVRGIEPPCSAWEADILPLNYTRIFQLGEAYYNTPPGKLQAFFLSPLPVFPLFFYTLSKTLFVFYNSTLYFSGTCCYNVQQRKRKEVKLVKEYPRKPDVDDMIFGDDRTVPSQR